MGLSDPPPLLGSIGNIEVPNAPKDWVNSSVSDV